MTIIIIIYNIDTYNITFDSNQVLEPKLLKMPLEQDSLNYSSFLNTLLSTSHIAATWNTGVTLRREVAFSRTALPCKPCF